MTEYIVRYGLRWRPWWLFFGGFDAGAAFYALFNADYWWALWFFLAAVFVLIPQRAPR